jgi:hypothetical protein
MAQRLIADKGGRFAIDVSVHGLVLSAALEREDADEVLTCAMIAALSVLAQEGPWPDALLRSMWHFMAEMRHALRQEAFI